MITITSEKLKELGLAELECSPAGRLGIDHCEEHGECYLHDIPSSTQHKIWFYIKATTYPLSPYIESGYSINDILLHASEYETWEEFLTAYDDKENHNYFTCKDYTKAYMLIERIKSTDIIDSSVAIIMKYIPEDVINDFFESLSH
jgi:hypothetical protein|tara:strand:+ start:1355 stop:1792 length:438 start_codon:yes stop_codon:yes gene_type:complete